jgi:AAA+ ATPase superfamily predicted ATPase
MAVRVPRKPAKIIDRDTEWGSLVELAKSRGPELAFVLGRRRVGKSFVLSQFAHRVKGLYYQASSRTENEQLLNLSQVIGETFKDPALQRGVAFPNWDALLDDLTARASSAPLLVVLDEFPYLAAAAAGLTSLIQRHWDHKWHGVPIKLVLSGSHITAMQRLESGDQPLYGRRTARIPFMPFSYKEMSRFLPKYSPADQLRAYGIFGGLPGHLVLLKPDAGLGENVTRLMLRPNGRLYDDAQHMLDAFLPGAEVYYSIIEAIARGERSWSKITSRVGRDGGALQRPAQWLQEMEIINRVVPVTESDVATSKRALYEISDPYVSFWHRFVAPLVSSGGVTTADGALLWSEVVEPRLDNYMGEVFEGVCRNFVREGGVEGFRPIRAGRWWGGTSTYEIDVVAFDARGDVLVGECKWGQINSHDFRSLREKTAVLVRELKEVTSFKYVLFSRQAPTDPVLLQEIQAGQVAWYDIPALFK